MLERFLTELVKIVLVWCSCQQFRHCQFHILFYLELFYELK